MTLMAASNAEGGASGTTLDPARKTKVLMDVPRQFGSGGKVDPADWADFVRAQNEGMTTGPRVGERVPDFTLADQTGKQHSLPELMGPNGLLLVFTRSADW
jgi:hypothetical protein